MHLMRLLNVLAHPQLDPEQTVTNGELLITTLALGRWRDRATSSWSPCGRVCVTFTPCGKTWLVGYRQPDSARPSVVVPFAAGTLDALIVAAMFALVDDLAELATQPAAAGAREQRPTHTPRQRRTHR